MDEDMPPTAEDNGTADEAGSWPRVDGSSRYHATLEESAREFPLITDALMRADRHRPRRWQQFIDPLDRQALDALIGYLTSASHSLAEFDAILADLPKRMADDVRIALEGLLSGHLQIVVDAMRDMMETEILIRDFALDPDRIDIWRNASGDELWDKFRPGKLRKRQSDALSVPYNDVPGAADYAAHSSLLHVSPKSLFPRAPESGAMAGYRAISILDSLSDIIYHGSSAVQAMGLLFASLSHAGPDSMDVLAALAAAADDLAEAHGAVSAIEKRIVASIPGSEQRVPILFESGLVILFDPGEVAVKFFKTDRIDFRTFHRSVSEYGGADIKLTLLQGGSENDVTKADE